MEGWRHGVMEGWSGGVMEGWRIGGLERGLPFRIAIGSGPQILDGDDVQRVEGHDLTIAVHHRQGARSDQDHFRMTDGIFAAVRGAHRKWVKPAAGYALANSFQIHAGSISPRRSPVNRASEAVAISVEKP